jgi:cold shock CspA family protein
MGIQETKQIAGRVIGVVTRIDETRERGFCFLKDGENNEYFLHRSSCLPNTVFDDLQQGDPVSFSISSTPKGFKAFDLKRATAAEETAIEQMDEFRGNR